MAASAGPPLPAAPARSIRVTVAGDEATGKSSLIAACATEAFPDRAPPVLPPTRLPNDFYPDRTPLLLIDTSSRREDLPQVEAELRRADAIVLTYACDKPRTLESLCRFWLPMLRRLQVKAAVVVVGCRLDLRGERQPSLESAMAPLMHEFREIEACLECSALRHIQVAEVFYYAQKAVLHPTGPLFDQQTQNMRPRCIRALKRIFALCDTDKDGALSDAELNNFQMKCFSAPLQPAELQGVKKVVLEKVGEGVSGRGLTLTGFLFLHALFIEKGRIETTWAVLRTFGYADDLLLRPEELAGHSFKCLPDQSVELTEKGLHILTERFAQFDVDKDGELNATELEASFSTAPASPWEGLPYMGSAATGPLGGLPLNSYIALWEMLAAQDPGQALAQLVYACLDVESAAACLRITKRRRLERKRGKSTREVLHCLLLGPRDAGKSSLLDSFLSRSWHEGTQPTVKERWAVNVVGSLPSGAGREAEGGAVLIVREVADDALPDVLKDPQALAPYDVAAFVYDSSHLPSWHRCADLLEAVAGAAEVHGYELPCLLVAAKDDLPPHPAVFPHSAKVCADMGLQPPLPVSARLGDTAELWARCVAAAARPHRAIPETSTSRSSKAYRRFMQRSVVITSVGVAVAVTVIVGYRFYLRRSSNQ